MDDIALSILDKTRALDAPIVVKCKFQRSCKRITFGTSSSLSFGLLKAKVDQSFSLSRTAYAIKYRDDENEVTDISCDTDLWEAVEYFSEGTDESSATSSIVSFASDGMQKVLLPVFIEVEYEGPSLSETMSLRSTHESMRFGSQSSLPYYIKSDGDTASVAESSRHSYRRPAERLLFTPDNISIVCGFIASIQAPLLYSILDNRFKESVGMRLIHTLFTWSILFHIFGAIIATVSKLSGSTSQRLHWQCELPAPVNAINEGFLRRISRLISDRASKLALRSGQIFTILGMFCLLAALMSLMWITHPLTLHTISMRSMLMLVTWVFLACVIYHSFESTQ